MYTRRNKIKHDSPIKAVYLVNQLYDYIDTMIPYLNKRHEEFNMNKSVQNCISVLIINSNSLHSIINTMDIDTYNISNNFTLANKYLTIIEVNCITLVDRHYITAKQGFYIGGMILNIRKALQSWESYYNKHHN